MAVAASLATHIVAAWGAGLWMASARHPNPSQVISIRPIGSEQSPETASSEEPLRQKRADALYRLPPPSTERPSKPDKTLIAQKPAVARMPAGLPYPEPSRAAAKSRLAEAEPSLDVAASHRGPPAEAPKPDGAHEGPSPSPRGETVVVAALDGRSESDRALRLDAIRRRIQEALVYPAAARRFGWEGSALVRIVLAPDGALSALSLESSSRIAVLDKEVLAAVRRAAPYPYVEGPIVVPVVFDLRAP